MTDSTRLTPLLHQLEQRLTEYRAPIIPHLRAGAEPARSTALLLERGATPTQELLDWWAWHDGTDAAEAYGGAFVAVPENLLLANWHLPSLAEAASSHDRLQRSWGGELPRSWWPVLRMSVPAVLCADTAGTGELFLVDAHADLPSDPPEPLARSLSDFLQLLLQLFAAGAVVADSPVHGGLALDPARLPADLPWPAYW